MLSRWDGDKHWVYSKCLQLRKLMFFSIYALGSLPLMHDDLISSVGLHHTMTLEVKQRERKTGASNKQQTARKKER